MFTIYLLFGGIKRERHHTVSPLVDVAVVVIKKMRGEYSPRRNFAEVGNYQLFRRYPTSQRLRLT